MHYRVRARLREETAGELRRLLRDAGRGPGSPTLSAPAAV